MGAHGRWADPLTRRDLLGGEATGDLTQDRELTVGERQARRRCGALAGGGRDGPAGGQTEGQGGQLTQAHAV